MSESRSPGVRWLVSALVVVAVGVLGWYIGSRAGGDASPAPPPAQSDPDFKIYRNIAGRVVRVAPEVPSITVDHEEIEGFMRAMTMDLKVAESVDLTRLKPGDAIHFDLARIDHVYQVVHIRLASQATDAPEPGAATLPVEDALGRGDLVPDLTLFNAEGERFRLREMRPQRKLITFFYARCPLENFCPAQSARLAQLQKYLEESGSEVHLLSLTLDAEHDGPEVLAGYAQRFHADPARWTLAGSEDADAIRQFARRAGARVQAHADSGQIDHALIALRVDGDRIVDRVYGLEAIEKLLHQM